MQAISGLCSLICYLLMFQFPTLTLPEYTHSQSRRLLELLVDHVHLTKTGCPQVQSRIHNFSQKDFEPLSHSFNTVLSNIITPKALQKSFDSDLNRAVSFSELISSWLTMNDHLETPSNDLKLVLKPMMGAFMQISNIYHLNISSKKNLPIKSNVISLSFCANEELLFHVISTNMEGKISPIGLCKQFNIVNSFISPINTSGNMLGYWAPLHCHRSSSGNPILLHFIIPIPLFKSLRLIFEFDIRNLILDFCSTGLNYCLHSTMKCVYRQYKNWPFDYNNYICQCKTGFYTDNLENGYPASVMSKRIQKANDIDRWRCKTCSPDCPNCTSGRQCAVDYNMQMIRGMPLAMQTFSITTCLFLAFLTFRLRRTKIFKTANWLFLELVIFGAVVLYFATIVMYFQASEITCILLPWLREIGFSIMYGVLVVKLYKSLLSFQSRKAHRVHVKDKDLFKYLGWFVAIVIVYLLTWTTINLDFTRFNNLLTDSTLVHYGIGEPSTTRSTSGSFGMLVKGRIVKVAVENIQKGDSNTNNSRETTYFKDSSNQKKQIYYQYFHVCRALSWDILVELGELLFISLGIHYCRIIWSAPSEYHENRCILFALIVEFIVSGTLYLTRHFIWYTVHPDIIFLIYFIRCHLTISLNITVLFGLKFWYIHKPPNPLSYVVRGRGMVGAVPGAAAAHSFVSYNKFPLSSNGEFDLADINLVDMDPEVIRRELKRLYTAIEIYKTKTMRRDNPHISKRRGGRKQRRFSLQPFHKKHQGQTGIVSESVLNQGDFVNDTYGDSCSTSERAVKSTGMKTLGIRGYISLSHNVHPSMVLDEETSRVSEESINSLVDQSAITGSPLSLQDQSSANRRSQPFLSIGENNRGLKNTDVI